MSKFNLLATVLPALALSRSFAIAEGASFADSVGASDPAPQVLNTKEFKYFFKTPVIKDEEGKEIGKGEKHPDVTAAFPVPSVEQLIEALSHVGETVTVGEGKDKKEVPTQPAKVAALILDTINELIKDAGKVQINEFLEKNADNPEARFSATQFDLSRLTLEYIATLEKGQRGAWAPSEDDLKAFNEDYTNIFVHEVQYDPKKVKVHCDQFTKGFAKIKADKLAVQKMKDFLMVWASKTQNMDTNEPTYGWLIARADKYLKAEEKNFAEAL